MTQWDSGVQAMLLGGYALVLLGIAFGLDFLARHIHQRSDRLRTAGFRYVPHHDHWVCPANQPLWPHSTDPKARLVHYRGRPSICNACPEKTECTDSAEGREITLALDPWPHSEAGRFHRGMALIPVALAGVFLIVAVVLDPSRATALWITPAGLVWAGSAWLLTNHFRHTPARFPVAVPIEERSR